MPSTYAHRRFGANVLEHLPDELRAQLEQNRELYDIGLHGPDLLFYYHAAKSNPVGALGNAMHEKPGRVFFDRARRVVHCEADRDAALAYALGFVCHFALDSTCHPYVEQFTRESGVTHCEIETEFDNMLMRRDGLQPAEVFHSQPYPPVGTECKGDRALLRGHLGAGGTGLAQGHDLSAQAAGASNPVKRWVVLTGMKVVGKYDMLHGLVADPQPNPKCVKSGKQLEALYAKALPLAETLILEFMAKLDTASPHTFGSFEGSAQQGKMLTTPSGSFGRANKK